jgi:hypothetical protein
MTALVKRKGSRTLDASFLESVEPVAALMHREGIFSGYVYMRSQRCWAVLTLQKERPTP